VVFIQDPSCAMKKDTKPWDLKGRIFVGDFIRVLKGNYTKKEVFVKVIKDSFEILVEETRKDPSQLLMISKGI
jgi:ribosomal protein S7